MCRLKTVVRRIAASFRKGRLDDVLDEEVRFHLEMEAERMVQGGMTSESARTAARRNFGVVEQVKESYRDRRGLPTIEALGRDRAHAARL